MSIRTRFEYNLPLINQRFAENRVIGIFLAETCARYMDKFVPMDTGALSQNFVVEPFKVTYTQPYAHKQFNGDNFNFRTDKHPNATAHWDKATQVQHSAAIASETTAFLRTI